MFHKPFVPSDNPPESQGSPEHPHSPEYKQPPDSPAFSTDNTDDNFDLHIQNILAEYDMMEAAEYDTEQHTDFNESFDDSYYNNKGDA